MAVRVCLDVYCLRQIVADAERASFLPTSFAWASLLIVQVAVILYLIYDGVGVAMFVGMAVVILQLPVLGYLFGSLLSSHQSSWRWLIAA